MIVKKKIYLDFILKNYEVKMINNKLKIKGQLEVRCRVINVLQTIPRHPESAHHL